MSFSLVNILLVRHIFSFQRCRLRAVHSVLRAVQKAGEAVCYRGSPLDVLRAYSRYVSATSLLPLLSLKSLSVCLWGNSTDLSLLINMTEEQIKALQSTGGEALAETEKNILGNHMARLWEVVRDLKKNSISGTDGRIDFVLDNAGFELYCDCVYGAYMRMVGAISEY